MGWFSKKEVKEEPKKDELAFPSFKTDFPKYESQVNSNVPLPPQPMPRDAPMPPLKRPPTFDQPYKPLAPSINPTQDISQPPVRPRVIEQPAFTPPPTPQRVSAPNYAPAPQMRAVPMPQPRPQPMPQRQMPAMQPRAPPVHSVPEPTKQGKTMFIKVDQYEDALDKIDKVMQQIQMAEDTLRKIEEIRAQEVNELAMWKKELDDVKNKLKTVDRALFGR